MTTTRNTQRSTFSRSRDGNPSGCFACEGCGKNTRHTEANSGTPYCADCYAAMESENGVADSGHPKQRQPHKASRQSTVAVPASSPLITETRKYALQLQRESGLAVKIPLHAALLVAIRAAAQACPQRHRHQNPRLHRESLENR